MKKWFARLGAVFFLILCLTPSQDAQAVAQWARKYKMDCQTCHTSFPRLNVFGEKFAKNGYQMPESEDGDETKEKIGDNGTFVDGIGNLLGVRISVSPFVMTTKALNVDGEQKLKYGFGDTKWVQLFTAGSIFKNASIFIETEIEQAAVHFNWFTLGYHNLFGTKWANVRAGRLSMLNWAAQTGRLRMVPNINTQFSTTTPSAGAAGEDSFAYGSPVPGLELFGYNDWFLYSFGVSNGKNLADANQFKNLFGTFRVELPEGDFAGSALTASGVWGKDTKNSGEEAPAVAQTKNTVYSVTPGVNVRWKSWDFIGSAMMTKEKNADLATGVDNTRYGYSGQLGYMLNPKWFAALQYDKVQDSVNSTQEYHKISENITFMPRQNMRLGLTLREELQKRTGGRQHELLFNVRAMF